MAPYNGTFLAQILGSRDPSSSPNLFATSHFPIFANISAHFICFPLRPLKLTPRWYFWQRQTMAWCPCVKVARCTTALRRRTIAAMEVLLATASVSLFPTPRGLVGTVFFIVSILVCMIYFSSLGLHRLYIVRASKNTINANRISKSQKNQPRSRLCASWNTGENRK